MSFCPFIVCFLLFYKTYLLNSGQHPERIKRFSIETYGKLRFGKRRFLVTNVIPERITFISRGITVHRFFYSSLLHVSAVYVSYHQVDIGSQRRIIRVRWGSFFWRQTICSPLHSSCTHDTLLNVSGTNQRYQVSVSPLLPTPHAPDYSTVSRTMAATTDAGTSFHLFTRMNSAILSMTFSR